MRNGLIHEGRVKYGCYLDNDIEETVQIIDDVLKFNPDIILKEVEIWLKHYFGSILKGEEIYQKIREYIEKNIIIEDLKAIEKRHDGNMFPC